ncbi:Wall-associated receptor kinase 5 [Hordeum vulgare]|nr:Wall-associated receptor kinase 5 [Hordeum vulgare]
MGEVRDDGAGRRASTTGSLSVRVLHHRQLANSEPGVRVAAAMCELSDDGAGRRGGRGRVAAGVSEVKDGSAGSKGGRGRRRVTTAVRCGPCGHRPPKLFLGDGTVEVLEISIPTDTVCVNSSSIALSPTVGAPGKKANGTTKYHTWSGFRRGGQFFVSPEKNKFLVLSCSNVQALLMEDSITVNACATYCPPAQERDNLSSSP